MFYRGALITGLILLAVVAGGAASAAHAQPGGASDPPSEAAAAAALATPDEELARAAAIASEAEGVAAAAAAWAKTDAYARSDASASVARTIAEYEQSAGNLYAAAAGMAQDVADNWATVGNVIPQYNAETAAVRYDQKAALSYERAAAAAAKWSSGIDMSDLDARQLEADIAASVGRTAEEEAVAAWTRSSAAVDRQVEVEAEANLLADRFAEAERAASAERLAAAERAAEAVAADGTAGQAAAAKRAVAAERAAERAAMAFIRDIDAAAEWVPEADRIIAEFVPAMESRDWERAKPLYERFAELGSDAAAQMAAGLASGRDAAREYGLAASEWTAAGNDERAAEARERAAGMAAVVGQMFDQMSDMERMIVEFDRRLDEMMAAEET